MELELDGQTAVIVGAAQGIGEAIARQFARQRAPVVLLDRDPRVRETAEKVAGEHVGILFLLAALIYWLSIRWVDRHGSWQRERF